MPETYKPESATPAEPHSPTGTPLLPPQAVPWAMGVVTVAVALSEIFPSHTVAAKVAHGVAIGLAALLGLASPGLRRR